MTTSSPIPQFEITIPADSHLLSGILSIPEHASGVVVFAHGSGSGRFSPRNQYVAQVLQHASIATLLLDLLEEEEAADRSKIFDIELLAQRVIVASTWLRNERLTKIIPIGYFGASTGAGAALVAAAAAPELVSVIVSRGGRPDLAGEALKGVQTPTLLLVGENDGPVVDLNTWAFTQLRCPKKMVIIPGASHLFEETGTLDQVAQHATSWFRRYMLPH